MIAQNTQELQKFISENNLKREDGIILFNASIDLHAPKRATTFNSEVQVIRLPQEMALYIYEFCDPEKGQNEMYRTGNHQFVRLAQNKLEIRDEKTNTRLIISL